MRNKVLIFLVSLVIISCGNEQREFSVTFVFDKPITGSNDYKYPKYFNEVLTPFSTDCKFDFFSKPISILRLDISNKVINTNALSAYENSGLDQGIESYTDYIGQYFNDSTNAYLYQPSVNEVNIENWIENNKKNLIIFSEEIEENEYKGVPIYHNTKDIVTKIQSSACQDTLNKVVILVNPSLNGGVPPPPPAGTQPQILSFSAQPQSIQKGNTATLSWQTQNAASVSISNAGTFAVIGSTTVSPQKTTTYTLTATDVNGITATQNISVNVQGGIPPGGGTPPPPPPVNCTDQVTPQSDLYDLCSQIADKNIPACRKNKLKSYLYNHFTADAEIFTVTNRCATITPYTVSQFYSAILGSGNLVFHKSECEQYMEKSGNKYKKFLIQIGR